MCLFIFVIAMTCRTGWGVYRYASATHTAQLEFPDEQQYWLIAQSLHNGEGLQDELGFRATRMPLYPGFLSLFTGFERGILFAKMFQWMFGAIAACLAALLATSIWNPRVGLLAGLMVALDPFLIFFSSLLLTETIFITTFILLWGSAWLVIKPVLQNQEVPLLRWIMLGVSATLCVYFRESTLGIVFVLLGMILIIQKFNARCITGSAATLVTIFLLLLPWAYRNHQVTGDWCFLTHRAGISLYDGVRLNASGESDLGDIKNMEAVRDLSEVEWNRYFWNASVLIIQEDPTRIVRLAAIKFARMWNPFPNVETYQSPLIRFVSAAWTLPLYSLALIGCFLLWRARRADRRIIGLWLLLPALYYSALHSLFIGSVRYRLGAVVMLEILAAFALSVLIEKIYARQSGKSR